MCDYISSAGAFYLIDKIIDTSQLIILVNNFNKICLIMLIGYFRLYVCAPNNDYISTFTYNIKNCLNTLHTHLIQLLYFPYITIANTQ